MELTPQSIRDVRFRQALRGYNPEDVDSFITDVVAGVEEMQRKLAEAQSRILEADTRSSDVSDAEESLRRTLVLAQRTADMAVREAQEEAARLLAEATEERDAVLAQAESLRTHLLSQVERDVADERTRLVAERDALLRDVETLRAHLAQERERLRIYFTDQLRRVDLGEPGVAPPPPVHAEPAADAGAAASADGAPHDAGTAAQDGPTDAGSGQALTDRTDDTDRPDGTDDSVRWAEPVDEEDPFLAELRRAVTDTEPLGPRDEPPAEPAAPRDDPYDIFEDGESGGRFLRRRR